MVKDPYNITLKSTKRNIITVAIAILLIVAGIVLMANNGFNKTMDLLVTKENVTDGLQFDYALYTINFALSILIIAVAIAMIMIRRDVLGTLTGLALLLFVLFFFTIGCKTTSGGIAGTTKKENVALPTIIIEKITKN